MTKLSPAGFFQEVRRRRVFHVAAMYIVGAFVALQVADLAFPGMSVPDTAIQFVWIGALIGFPFALFFGWRFDLADGRILRTAAVDGEAGSPIGRGDTVTLAIMTAALVTICVGLAIEISTTRTDDPDRPKLAIAAPNSLAVLPFANFDGVANNEYLADGITETLLHALAQASSLSVTARTSSFFYKGKDIDVRDIANELGVSKILEGSVQQSGDKIRIVAQLIEADTGFHLWSNTYDRDFGDIFAIQDSIASDVAIAILATMTAAPGLSDTQLSGVSTTNLEAYQKYLQGLEQARITSNVSLPKAEAFFQQALAIDPEFFEATKELAYATLEMLRNGTIPNEVALDRLSPLRDKMLQRRPDDGATIWTDASIRYYQDRGSIDADILVAKLIAAIERTPNDARLYGFLELSLSVFGRHDEATEWLNRALVIDPMDFKLHWRLGVKLSDRSEYLAAIEAFKRVTEINPQYPTGHSSLAWAELEAGDSVVWYQGMSVAAALDPLDNEMESSLAYGLLVLGLYEESSTHVARASKMNAANGGEWFSSSLLSLIGDPEESRSLTESFLRSELNARGGGYRMPVWVYVSVSIDAGKAQEALAVIEEIFPGSTAEDFVPTSEDEFFVQFGATVAWAHGKETDEVVARLDALVPRWDAAMPNWTTRWGSSTTVAFLRGNMEEASQVAVEVLSGTSFVRPFLYQYLYPLYVVAEQPAVAARLAEIEEEIRPRREALRAYIQQSQ